jgi:hypothetical protein
VILLFKHLSLSRGGSLIVRDQASYISRRFWVAFAYALLMHLAGLLCFQVVPFQIKESGRILPPFQAEAALPMTVLADIEQSRPVPSGLPPFVPASPAMAAQPEIAPQHLHLPIAGLDRSLPFLSIERGVYETMPSLRETPSAPSLKIQISGALAGVRMANSGRNLALPAVSSAQRTVYNVQVESSSGRVFWYEPVQLSADREFNHFSEKVLRQLHFQASPAQYFISGQVELHYLQGGEA